MKPKNKHANASLARRFRLPILDATREITLRVSREQCRLGVKDSPEHCALALAAKSALRGLRNVQVFRRVAYFQFASYVERFLTDTATGKQIRRFDTTGSFVPGDYRFIPVRRSERLGDRRPERRRTGEQSQPATRKPVHHVRPRGSGGIGWTTT